MPDGQTGERARRATVAGKSVGLARLRVRVDRRLLHAAELRLARVRRHGRGGRGGQDVGVRPEAGNQTTHRFTTFLTRHHGN